MTRLAFGANCLAADGRLGPRLRLRSGQDDIVHERGEGQAADAEGRLLEEVPARDAA